MERNQLHTAAPDSALLPANAAEPEEYRLLNEIDRGSFGVVYRGSCVRTGKVVAIKKVLQDKRFKNRELQLIKDLRHPNLVECLTAFLTSGRQPGEQYLNIVMEYMPETLYRVIRSYALARKSMPILLVKVYSYQIFRSLAYIHGLGITHRDIKPQNYLVDQRSHAVKLCDFGSAKKLLAGEPSVAYISSRYYRAPELILGSTNYSTAIDLWGVGCIIVEMLLGKPVFTGNTGIDQLVEIMKVLGAPTRQQLLDMNPHYTESRLPTVNPLGLPHLFKPETPAPLVDLLVNLLAYSPAARPTAVDALLHPFFDELRDPATVLPSGVTTTALFDFTCEEICGLPEPVVRQLVPEWYL